jgi:signal transduction histidine kinase
VIRSLRLKFFLIVWPLVVAALVVFGFLLGNWSRVELARMSMQVEAIRHISSTSGDLIDSLAAIPRDAAAGIAGLVERFTAGDSLLQGVVLASVAEGVLLNTLDGVPDGDITIEDGGTVTVESVLRDGPREAITRVKISGLQVDPPGDPDPRFVALVPQYRAHRIEPDITDSGDIPDAGAVLQRRIVQALLVGSAIAALLTLMLSGRLTGRVTTLAGAAGELGRGNLAARVPVEGHDEVAGLATAFNEMAVSLEESEGQRRRMVSDVAHELRTPLTNLIGLVRMALDGLRPADRDLLGALEEESLLLQHLVDDLRDLALADAGELRVHLEAVDPVDAARRAVAGFDPRLGVVVEAHGAVRPVAADPERLGQVLRNLIQNATTHSPEPGSVRVTVQPSPGGVAIGVTDRGPGIAPEHLGRIWERFYRVDPSRARETGGMGLGLSVARRLVEAMGGSVEVESTVGEGTRFTVRLGGVSVGRKATLADQGRP